MATMQQVCICALILTVIAWHEVQLAEGRKVKALKKLEFPSAETTRGAKNHQKNKYNLLVTAPVSLNNINIARKKDVSPPVMPEQEPGFGSSAVTYTNGFRPTTPGNSPGVGHSYAGFKAIVKTKQQGKAPSATYSGSIDDFRPTAPGHSPGVGHSFPGLKANVKRKLQGNAPGATYSSTGSIDDFRPTAPGHSPGVGQTKPQGNAPGATYSSTGSIDDFRPTAPGDSPGVGHSIGDEK